MKAQYSTYLQKQKMLARKLVDKLYETYNYVSLLAVDTTGKKYFIRQTGMSLEDSTWSERGYVIRVYNGTHYTEHSFNQFNESTYDSVIKAVHEAVSLSCLLREDGIEATNYALIEDEAVEASYASELETTVGHVGHAFVINELKQIMEKTAALSDQIVDVRVGYEEVHVSKLFISGNKTLEQSYVWSNGVLIPIAYHDGRYKYSYEMFSGLVGTELLNGLKKLSKQAADNVLCMIHSTPMPQGEYDIILDPDLAGLLAHEAFGHGVEMDMFVKKRAKAADYMGEMVASNCVQMFDGAKGLPEASSYYFDDEGTLGTNTQILENGVLQKGISDLLSAMQLETKPTGNGKRESFERKAYARMTNTYFGQGNSTLDEMIESIEHGYLLEGFLSGMEDAKNWGIQCVASRAREIIDGKLTGKVHSPIYITGYVPDLLKSISMVGNELVIISNGTCAKGVKEKVKTATGGPYLKARGKLS